ncbi:hypothetical protein ACJIZ3_010138 [Penstemon smallii]|uniref:BED-type domain-containing protein n=1 Tax=Penstemon smallii TaxID=265156 RepID=A0ABD3TGE5_9LAMI
MGSIMESGAGTRPKRDPAWKHCEMLKNENKIELKCIYCGKIFKGGGIFRIKEHLAGQKGNGATCLKVKPDVRSQMLETLNGLSGKKRNKERLPEETSGYNPGTSGNEVLDICRDLNADIDLLSMNEMLERESDVFANGEVAVTSHKRDPAWKHCEKLKNGNKVQLKCIYCGKIFKGGGIYRIKEHLAGQKGNGVTCLKVQPDVRSQMRDSLNVLSGKRRKKGKLPEETSGSDNPGSSGNEDICRDLNAEIDLHPVNEMLESDVFVNGELAVTPLNRDPAWNHCERLKNGNKVQLKCIYCGKIFKGGGIYRLKEHLAGQKGNGVTCLKVQPDVRSQLRECLNGLSGKKRKKQKLLEETSGYENPGTSLVEVRTDLNAEIDLLPVHEMIEHDSNVFANREDAGKDKSTGRKPNGRAREDPDVDNSNTIALTSLQAINSEKLRNAVHMAVGRFFFDVGLPMDAVNSAYFQPMIVAISSHGPGAVGPSYHDLRSRILKNSVHEVRNGVDKCRGAWARTGCSILVNEQNSANGKIFINFLVYCPESTIFLRSADISNAIDPADFLYELLREVVEEVGVGNVLQVVTNCEDRYVIVGKRLTDTYPTVFWTPCTGHCIDLMLEDIGEILWVKRVLVQAKSISRYIYTNNFVLNMMRRYTSGVEIVDVGITRSSSDFMTLKRMVEMRRNLQLMVTSEEWMESPYSKKPEGFAVLDYISNESFWSACALVTRLTDPLLRLLRIVGSKKKPAMGFVYAGLYRAKETFKKELVSKNEYLVYWNIIDHRWKQLQRHPLHAAGFFFNPKFFYRLEGDAHYHMRSLVYDCIEKVVPDPQIQDKVVKETASYHDSVGDLGRNMAIRARDTFLPTEWWLTYGGGCPNLSRLAVCILSQCCSLIQYRLNKIPLELMHKWKNCLEHQRLSDLVFVHYNMSLKQMTLDDEQQKTVDPISYENIDIVGDWVMDKEVGSEGLGTADWMAVDPPSGNVVLSGPPVDDIEALGTGMEVIYIWRNMHDIILYLLYLGYC